MDGVIVQAEGGVTAVEAFSNADPIRSEDGREVNEFPFLLVPMVLSMRNCLVTWAFQNYYTYRENPKSQRDY